jgi:mRNA interferase RelE/StbE
MWRMKTIILSPAAAKDFDALPASAQIAIDMALLRYAIEGTGHVIALVGREGFRLRVGEYRVIFDEDGATVLAFYIGRRSSTTYQRN